MKRELICIVCPRGCSLTVDLSKTPPQVTGNACKRGEQYGIEESTCPKRTVTSTVAVSNRPGRRVSVKTAAPVPKESIFEVMQVVRAATVTAPIEAGDAVVPDICGTAVIATDRVE